jgi:hypothetical protein
MTPPGGKADAGTGRDDRYHALDALRAFALLLGVVFHAAESFTVEAASYWAIGDSSTSRVLELFRHASHSFRLELFFLIAGFFAHLVWRKRGIGGFLRNRAGRIVVPLVVGWCLLYPLLVFLWLVGAAKSGRWDLVGVPEEFRAAAPWQLALGFFLTFQFVGKFDLTHLWFLHQLLVLYGLALAVRALVLRLGCGSRVIAGLDAGVRRLVTSRWKLAWFTAAVLPALCLQHGWGVDTPKASLVPELPATTLFALLFGLGWALHRQPDLLAACGRHWRLHLAIGAVLSLPSFLLLGLVEAAGWFEPHRAWVRLVYCLVYGLMMGAFVFGFLGLFLHHRRTESPAWRYVADSSYWVYLTHLPLVVALQVWMGNWPLPWLIKFPLINLIAFPLLFLTYHYLVRSTFIGRQLNGRCYPFQPVLAPWRATAGNAGEVVPRATREPS